MNILVTGASGQIGIPLIENLAHLGHHVIATDLDINRVEKLRLNNVESFKADIMVSESLNSKILQKADTLIHLAGSKVTDFNSGEELFQTNALGTVNVLSSLPKSIKRIVFSSTMSVYGEVKINPVTEDSLENPANLYGASKLISEKLCKLYSRQRGIDFISLRITGVYGGCLTENAISSFVKKALKNDKISINCGKETYRDYLYIDDCVDAIAGAVTTTKQGIFNIGSGIGTPIYDIAEKVISFSKSKSNLVLSNRKAQSTFSFVYDTTKSKQIPFIFKTSVDEGLKRFINN